MKIISIDLETTIARLDTTNRVYLVARIPALPEWVEVLFIPDCGLAGAAWGGAAHWYDARSLDDAIEKVAQLI